MRLSYAIATLNREPKIRGDRLCNTLYYSPGDSWDKIEEEDSEPPAPKSMNTFRVQMIALSDGNATVKERANVIIQPGTLVSFYL